MRYQTLLIGHYISLMRGLPKLLERAGFVVDLVTTDHDHHKLKGISQVYFAVDADNLIALASKLSQNHYDLVVVGDDEVLLELVQSDLSHELKLKLLPVCTLDNFGHIGTKVGLSNVLQTAGIATPAFITAHDADELISILEKTDYSLMLKNDMSSGGAGVFQYILGTDPQKMLNNPLVFPLLVQQRIDGDVIDLSGFYQYGELIHFSYAAMNTFINQPFGPSSVRTYTQLSTVPAEIFEQMRHLGRALGAHGFVNVTCIYHPDERKHYVIEGDMRPNVWVDYSRYLGNDPATAIRQYFDLGLTLTEPQPLRAAYPKRLLIPYIYRLTVQEILTNRYHVWSYCDRDSVIDIFTRAFKKLITQFIKPKVSLANWQRLRRIWGFITYH